MDSNAPGFGATLRLLRTEASLSLRELAERIGVSGAYLSRVENGHDPAPTPDRLVAIATVLGVPAPVLLELAQQTGPAVAGYLERVPAANALFLEIARRDLNAAQIARLRAFMDTEFSATSTPVRSLRLGQLLSPERVILGLKCTDLDDLIDVAVTRLPRCRIPPSELARRMKAHERDSPSVIGNGLVAPHAVVEGIDPAAVLVSVASRAKIGASDGSPLRVAVVLVSGAAGQPHLEVLARIARLARYQIGDELRSTKTPQQALALVERIESLW